MNVKVWIALFLVLVNGKKVKSSRYRDLLLHDSDEIDCNLANLTVLASTHIERHMITVSFELINPKFNDCFEKYLILLVNQNRFEKNYKMFVDKPWKVWNYNESKKYSYTFENIPCGTYQILIQPCNFISCSLFYFDHPILMNMSSSDCTFNSPKSLGRKTKESSLSIERQITIGLGVASLIIIIAISGWIYHRFRSGVPVDAPAGNADVEEGNSMLMEQNIHVFIFNFFDGNDEIRTRATDLKYSLLESSYFASVKGIEDELTKILFNVNDWLNNMLERNRDGSIMKIIIINSEEYEDERHELENLIFSEFLDKILNSQKDRTDYDTLFVVQYEDINTTSERLQNIVCQARYKMPLNFDDLLQNLSLVPH